MIDLKLLYKTVSERKRERERCGKTINFNVLNFLKFCPKQNTFCNCRAKNMKNITWLNT